MLTRYEKTTWRTVFFLAALITGYCIIEGIRAVENRVEKAYYWLKYRNWRYDK